MDRIIRITECSQCPHFDHRGGHGQIAYVPKCNKSHKELPHTVSFNSKNRGIAQQLPGIPDWCELERVPEWSELSRVPSNIEQTLSALIAENPDKVKQAQANQRLWGWFVGQTMKRLGGYADPQKVHELLMTKIKEGG